MDFLFFSKLCMTGCTLFVGHLQLWLLPPDLLPSSAPVALALLVPAPSGLLASQLLTLLSVKSHNKWCLMLWLMKLKRPPNAFHVVKHACKWNAFLQASSQTGPPTPPWASRIHQPIFGAKPCWRKTRCSFGLIIYFRILILARLECGREREWEIEWEREREREKGKWEMCDKWTAL